MLKHFLILSYLIFGVNFTYGKISNDKYSKELEKRLLKIKPVDLPLLSEKELKAKFKASEKFRKPAQANGNVLPTKTFQNIIDRFLNAKNPEELADMLDELDYRYGDKNSLISSGREIPKEWNTPLPEDAFDARFFATQVLPLRAFRGWTYRMRELFENNSSAIHSYVLTQAKNIATNFEIYLPSKHLKVVYDYLTSPYLMADGNVVKPIKNDIEFQTWIGNELLQEVNLSVKRLYHLDLNSPKNPTQGYAVWDQRLVYGTDSFKDGIKRYRYVGEIEKNLLMSSMFSTLASSHILMSYKLEGLINLTKKIGMLYGIDKLLPFGSVDGVNAEKWSTEMAAQNASTGLGTIIKSANLKYQGTDFTRLQWALKYTRSSVYYAKMAWEQAKYQRNDDDFALHTGYWRVNRDEISENINLLDTVVSSDSAVGLRSGVTGEVILVNYSAFFNPETSPSNLVEFLPQTFEKSQKRKRSVSYVKNGKNVTKQLEWRDYENGKPISWDTNTYSKYFPSVKSNDDIYRVFRVLSHSGGSWLHLN